MTSTKHRQFVRKYTAVGLVIFTLLTLYIVRKFYIYGDSGNLSAHKSIKNNVFNYRSDEKAVANIKSKIEQFTSKSASIPNLGSKTYSNILPVFGKSKTNLVLYPEIFHYLIPNDRICKVKQPDLLIGVQVSPRDVHQRVAARQTWANHELLKKQNSLVLFFLGRVADIGLMKNISKESDQYGDIVLDSYIDHYNNVSLKLISMLKWIKYHCPDLKWFAHADGDTFVIVPRIKDWIRDKVGPAVTSVTPYVSSGYIQKLIPPDRGNLRHAMPMEQFAGDIYPPFFNGCGYLINRAGVIALYNASVGSTYVWIEDVYVSGILGDKINMLRIPIPRTLMAGLPPDVPQSRLKQELFVCNRNSIQVKDLWNAKR